MGIADLVEKVFPLPSGTIRDSMTEEAIPAAPTIKGLISPEVIPIPFDACIALPGDLNGFKVRFSDGESRVSGRISIHGRDQLLAQFEEQIQRDGAVTALPDLTTLDGYVE